MSTGKKERASSCAAANNDAQDESEVLKLPEATNDPSIPSIQLGETITFQVGASVDFKLPSNSLTFEKEMGPVIINVDGTTRRIDNWDQMTKHEQEVAWKRISKRNEQRRKALLAAQEQQQNAEEGGDNQQNTKS